MKSLLFNVFIDHFELIEYLILLGMPSESLLLRFGPVLVEPSLEIFIDVAMNFTAEVHCNEGSDHIQLLAYMIFSLPPKSSRQPGILIPIQISKISRKKFIRIFFLIFTFRNYLKLKFSMFLLDLISQSYRRSLNEISIYMKNNYF